MKDLAQFELCTLIPESPIDPSLSQITSLKWESWERALSSHPDQAFSRCIVNGIRNGFRIGYNYGKGLLPLTAKKNMLSAQQHPEVIDSYITKEVSDRRILGPFPSPGETIHTSPFGVIPKRHQENKWRLILDLSHPEGRSVNDGIDPALCSLSYISHDQITEQILLMGRCTQMAKIDIRNAYRNIPVHPSDRHLLGMNWQGHTFVDGCLPFGLRSAPKIFNAIADALEWILRERSVKYVFHYLDDFLLLGNPESTECAQALATLMCTCEELGLPIASDKWKAQQPN